MDARQLPNGKWTSELGPDEDIGHEDPYCLEGISSVGPKPITAIQRGLVTTRLKGEVGPIALLVTKRQEHFHSGLSNE
jgi:hypothetical protein